VPFYDYECTACSLEFAAFQRLSDVPYLNCPDCGGSLKAMFQVNKGNSEKVIAREPDWKPHMTDVHKGWKKRRQWKHSTVESLETGEAVETCGSLKTDETVNTSDSVKKGAHEK